MNLMHFSELTFAVIRNLGSFLFLQHKNVFPPLSSLGQNDLRAVKVEPAGLPSV